MDTAPLPCARCEHQLAHATYPGSPVFSSYAGMPLCEACRMLLDHLAGTMPLIHQGWSHIFRVTCASATSAEFLAAYRSAAVRQADVRLDKVAPTGDTLAVKEALNRLNTAMRRALQQAQQLAAE